MHWPFPLPLAGAGSACTAHRYLFPQLSLPKGLNRYPPPRKLSSTGNSLAPYSLYSGKLWHSLTKTFFFLKKISGFLITTFFFKARHCGAYYSGFDCPELKSCFCVCVFFSFLSSEDRISVIDLYQSSSSSFHH